jgi:hypothetical protein
MQKGTLYLRSIVGCKIKRSDTPPPRNHTNSKNLEIFLTLFLKKSFCCCACVWGGGGVGAEKVLFLINVRGRGKFLNDHLSPILLFQFNGLHPVPSSTLSTRWSHHICLAGRHLGVAKRAGGGHGFESRPLLRERMWNCLSMVHTYLHYDEVRCHTLSAFKFTSLLLGMYICYVMLCMF